MFRILRAFAWLHWRMLINSLENTTARDTIQRFSIAIEKLGPIMAAVLMVPSALILAAAAVASGFALARGDRHSLLFEAARYLLFIVPIVSIFGPLLLPAADRTNPVRLLLLPISRSTLYVAQSSSAFGDVWVLLMLPIVLFVPLGLLAGGAVVAALVALVAGLLLVLVIVGITSLATSVLHLLVRNRRRGELLALLFIVVIPAASMLPGLLNGLRHVPGAAERPSPMSSMLPEWVKTTAVQAFRVYPPEVYARATRSAAAGEIASAGAGLVALTAVALVMHGLGMAAFAKVLGSPGSTGARRAVPTRAAWSRRLPGLSSGASAVASAQLRLALRTPRGRSIVLSPVVVTGIFAFVARNPMAAFDSGPFSFNTGLSIAGFASFVGLLAVLPIAMNQFAIDNAGLTLALLSPLSDREYLTGKAVGNGLIAALPISLSFLAALFLLPGGSAALWVSIPLALLSSYFLVAPVAATLSALFPRVVDLNSIGRGSNAHGLAALLGMISFVLSTFPAAMIVFGAAAWLHNSAVAPLLLVLWCGISYGIGLLLFIPARRIFAKRRENLAMLL
jgi:hypothetical protein